MKKKAKREQNIDEMMNVLRRLNRGIMIRMMYEGNQELEKQITKLKKEIMKPAKDKETEK